MLRVTLFLYLTAPAKPNRPTVDGLDVDKVRVTYNFGLGGGYTHEFLVMYRKKCKYIALDEDAIPLGVHAFWTWMFEEYLL